MDIASLVFFRIAFGAIMLWEVWRYFSAKWIYPHYIQPNILFTYYGFEWVRPWPGNGMYWHFALLGVAAACILFGFCYRVATVLFFLGFTYIFLLDQAQYFNHLYLVSLISLLLIFLPAHRAFSFDVRLRPAIRSDTVPAWTLWLLRAQIAIPYFYGGLAKLNADWLRGEPMRMWLAHRTDFPVLGPHFREEWMVWAFVYGGLFLDLLIVPFLLWRRTRLIAFTCAVAFHMLNNQLFRIGIFPWFMLAGTLLFFDPDWPRRWVRRWLGRWQEPTRGNVKYEVKKRGPEESTTDAARALSPRQKVTVALLGFYLGLQILIPFRHWLYPGNVDWTEEGHHYSWHMMLRSKQAEALFYVINSHTGETWQVHPLRYLTPRQVRKMSSRPDMILQFAHYLADVYRKRGHEQVEVRAHVFASLNGRKPQLLVNPNVDLAAQPRTWKHASWIVPLDERAMPGELGKPGEQVAGD